MLTGSKNISVRTRDADGKIIFVAKASIGDDTSANGVSRLEFEVTMPFKTLDELDSLLLKSGLSYQAKWSRDREEYKGGNMTICLDKNAGYGYLAEFEKVVFSAEEKDGVKKELEEIMSEMGAVELKQDRLERMFAYYNAHWQDYYGTDKVFNIE
jgi:predicted adenylyl cyclase CyaB